MRFANTDALRRAIADSDVELPAAYGAQGQGIADCHAKIDAQREAVGQSQFNTLEERFAALWQDVGGVPMQREVRFHPTRRWRFDFADVERKIAYEVQGGLYQAQSGHRSHDGVKRDAEKLNAAQMLGWRVFQINTYTMKDAEYMEELAQWHRRQPTKEEL